jgi:excisionase family DNA binding protein
MPPEPLNLLTVKETAEYLRIPVPTVYYLVQKGELPAVQIGGRWRIKKDALDQDILKMESAAAKPKQAPAKILVVDDQEEIRVLLTNTLQKNGFSAEAAASGKEALDKISQGEFSLVFLDIQLPDIPGEEVFERAVEMSPKLHVIMMTGFSTVANLEKILACGPVTVLQKPFKLDQLIHLAHVIARDRVDPKANTTA